MTREDGRGKRGKKAHTEGAKRTLVDKKMVDALALRVSNKWGLNCRRAAHGEEKRERKMYSVTRQMFNKLDDQAHCEAF